MPPFNRDVFVNCPFDDDYRRIFVAVLFTIKRIGYQPRTALESSDSSTVRIHKILGLIEKCKFGIHDLSRIKARAVDEHFRMNMPFELGIDYGAKALNHGHPKWKAKKLLVLEKEKYRYQKAISDLSGCDIKNHNDDPLQAMGAVRDWFLTEEKIKLPATKSLWLDLNQFNGYLTERLIEEGHEADEIEKIPIQELLLYLDDWLNDSPR